MRERPAVDDELGPGDEARIVAREVGDGALDLAGVRPAAERGERDDAALAELTDITGYRTEFLKMFGFGLHGINYENEVKPHIPMS